MLKDHAELRIRTEAPTVCNIQGFEIADIATTVPPDGYERVNGRQYPHEVVKSRLLKMDYETIIHVLDRFKENKTEIRNMRSYLLTALYNARDEKDIQFQNFFNHSYYGTDWTQQRRED